MIRFSQKFLQVHINGVTPWIALENGHLREPIELFRPLLERRKNEFVAFASEQKLPYMYDSTPYWSRRGWIRRVLDWVSGVQSLREDPEVLAKMDWLPSEALQLLLESSTAMEMTDAAAAQEKISWDMLMLLLKDKDIYGEGRGVPGIVKLKAGEKMLALLKRLGDLSSEIGNEMDAEVMKWKDDIIVKDIPIDDDMTMTVAVVEMAPLFEMASGFEARLMSLFSQISIFRNIWNPVVRRYSGYFENMNCPIQFIPDAVQDATTVGQKKTPANATSSTTPESGEKGKGKRGTKAGRDISGAGVAKDGDGAFPAGPFLFTRAFYAAQGSDGKLRNVLQGAIIGKKSLHHCWQALEKARVNQVQSGNLHRVVGYLYFPQQKRMLVSIGTCKQQREGRCVTSVNLRKFIDGRKTIGATLGLQ